MQEMQRDDRLTLPHPIPAGAAQQGSGASRPRRAGGGDATRGRRGASASDAAPEQLDAQGPNYVPRLRTRYVDTAAPALMTEFGYANRMRVPRIERIVLNVGEGDARDDAKVLEAIQQDLTVISGQKPVVTRARKSIAQFRIREGNPIGAKVTLRGTRMWDFLDRLMNVALPRTRDFRGVPIRGFDGRGDYSLGIREQIIFPEVDYNRIDKIRGLQVSIVTSARTDNEGKRLLELMGMPFAREDQR